MSERVTLRAYAKVNLVLEVLGTRPDGFHELDTVVQTIGLHDVVTVVRTPGPPVSVTGRFAAGVPVGPENLAWRALVALAGRIGRRADGWTVAIEKHIPAAGGLGGGSADAAAVLRALQRLWPGVSDADLLAAAAAVGSDEPALVLGGTVRARGRGERVEALAPLPGHDVVLFLPPETIERKTARMFAALGALPSDSGEVSRQFAARPAARLTSEHVHNAFERVAFDLFPALAALWEDLEARTDSAVRLSGAGPALFWIGPSGDGARVAERAQGARCQVVATKTVSAPWTP